MSPSAETLAKYAAVMASDAALESLVEHDGLALWLERGASGVGWLSILGEPNNEGFRRFAGETSYRGDDLAFKRCPTTPANAVALRATLLWLQPAPIGLNASFGFGDRLGRATPGHVRTLQRIMGNTSDPTLAPLFAQQSARENSRTGRSPQRVLDDATWGAFRAGWRAGVGADADHLKTAADIDASAAAGYSFYTLDPGDHVESAADMMSPVELTARRDALPWSELESDPGDLEQRYAGRSEDLETRRVTLSVENVTRAAVKYGRAIAHGAMLYRHLAAKEVSFEVEISVDETATPTTVGEHIYIVSELKRLGVRWVSLAPRFVGRFEKGVEYAGDLEALANDLRDHAEVARALGPYKLSLHSGSDKFSVYPLLRAATGGLFHVKTAGVSYLEALRVVATANSVLFREIVALARERYQDERASYHVSAEAERIPDLAMVSDENLSALLDQPDTRQALHVTYGSALEHYGAEIGATLDARAEEYAAALEQMMRRHLEPLLGASDQSGGTA